MRTVAIIQARMSSTRLPGKVLLDLAGQPMLDRVMSRVRRVATIDLVGVATSVEPSDDPIVEFCQDAGIACHRGSLHDVLDRYQTAAATWSADIIVRITADCPLIDTGIIGLALEAFRNLSGSVDYVSTDLPFPTYPRGLDVEVISAPALRRAWEQDDNPAWREHVTPFVYRHPEFFRIHGIPHPVDLSHHRWTVDTAYDLKLARWVYEAFGQDDFSWYNVLALLAAHPHWEAINSHVQQKAV